MKYGLKYQLVEIYLSVDYDNFGAKNLYLRNGFKLTISKGSVDIMMKSLTLINLPVSFGEAVDKLTILDIKLDKISDLRKNDVAKEQVLLFEQLEKVLEKSPFYYRLLKKVNLDIWEMQDIFRESDSLTVKNELCHKIILENDRRFRIKNKINQINLSYLKEQKGYNPKKAFFLGHLGLGDTINTIGLVRYLSTCYDKVIVVVKTCYQANIVPMFGDDESIELKFIQTDQELSPAFGASQSKFDQLTEGCDLFRVGYHKMEGRYHRINSLPFNFYEDVNLPINYFWDYFYLPETDKSKQLFQLTNNQPYIFVHNQSSQKLEFSAEIIKNKLQLDSDKIMFINPNYNMYQQEHPFYNNAAQFLNLLIIDYVDLIINSKALVLTDSAFFCLALQLPIKTDQCYYYSRNNATYEHIFTHPTHVTNGRKVLRNLRLITQND